MFWLRKAAATLEWKMNEMEKRLEKIQSQIDAVWGLNDKVQLLREFKFKSELDKLHEKLTAKFEDLEKRWCTIVHNGFCEYKWSWKYYCNFSINNKCFTDIDIIYRHYNSASGRNDFIYLNDITKFYLKVLKEIEYIDLWIEIAKKKWKQ